MDFPSWITIVILITSPLWIYIIIRWSNFREFKRARAIKPKTQDELLDAWIDEGNRKSGCQAQSQIKDARMPQFDRKMPPEEYTRYCASLLRSLGYGLRLTEESAGENVIIVARDRIRRYVILCEKDPRSVGEETLRELRSASFLFHARGSAIVSSSDEFNDSVKESCRLDPLLLCHESLDELDAHFNYLEWG